MRLPWTLSVFCILALSSAVACDDDDDNNSQQPPVSNEGGNPQEEPTVDDDDDDDANAFDTTIDAYANNLRTQGREVFRHDTFGSEVFWGDVLQLHRAVMGEALGGVGPGVSPTTALSVGLKVDSQAIPSEVAQAVQAGEVDLNDPAVTVTLLQLDAVVGVKGIFNSQDELTSIGITCAICHTDVDNSFSPGIGQRRDGWANRDLNVGAIIALTPGRSAIADLLGVDVPTLDSVLNSWGPGKFDAVLLHDGKATNPNGGSGATLIPPAFGLAGVNLHTWTGWGSVTYWNAYVANTQMMGQGTFFDPRLNDPEKYPVAQATGAWNKRSNPDLVTAKLPALQIYQLSIPAPAPAAGSFDADAAARGRDLFMGKADCARCHVPPLYVEPGWSMHTAEEMGIDDFQASRSPDEHYRTAPLKGLWTHGKGGYYHDGRFATLDDVLNHYNGHFNLGLTDAEKADVIQYVLSLGDEVDTGVDQGTGGSGGAGGSGGTSGSGGAGGNSYPGARGGAQRDIGQGPF